jgi:hypothetical protein
MIAKFFATGFVFLICHAIEGQEPVNDGRRPPTTLHEIGRVSPWSHIGSPPSQGSSVSRLAGWPAESASYHEAFDVIRRSWTGEVPTNSDNLRFMVAQYEDMIRITTESGGYGNLVLADSLRRLSLSLLLRYAVTHPSEYEAVGDILEKDRVRLLDCPATGEMVTEELNLAPPSGKWHLSENREDLDLIFRTNGSNVRNETGRTLFDPPVPSKLIHQRDVNGLLHRLLTDDMFERVSLAALIEFLRRGGTLTDLKSFDRVMRKQVERFRFPPLGIDRVWVDHVEALIEAVRKWEGKDIIPFSAIVGN